VQEQSGIVKAKPMIEWSDVFHACITATLAFAGVIVMVAVFLFQTRRSRLKAMQKEIDRLRKEKDTPDAP
jgi:heme/copper-type cytochrome/quinol oxidase subunit 2